MSLLDQPGRIGSLTVPRRSVFPPMLMNYASDRGEVTERLTRYYRSLARGGFGLIVTECIFPQFKGGIATRGLALYDDRFMPGFTRLVQAVHEEGGLLGAQIFFDGAGRVFASEETVSIGPSDLAPFGGPSMREMTEEELHVMAADFAAAAVRAKACGADLIELHIGHAHLLGRFASPYWNRRNDRYGGSRENRLRFPIEVLQKVRAVVGPDTPVTARLCLTEQIDGGIDLDEAVAIGKALRSAGLDAVHTSAGTGTSPKGLASIFPTSFSPDAPFAELAHAFRAQTGLTTIFAGKVRRHDVAERLLENGTADFISAGRAGLADPSWPRNGRRSGKAVPCIGCNQGCTDSLITRKEIICTVNPALGFEQEFASVRPLAARSRYFVVGGGVAGMTCAIGLADRGAAVVLLDTAAFLGGQYAVAARIPGKELYGSYLDYLKDRLAASSIEVRLNATDDGIRAAVGNSANVFWAGGAVAREWPAANATIPILNGWEIFGTSEKVAAVDNITVVGAGQIGCDAAIWFAERGRKVTLVDRLEQPLAALRARQYDYDVALRKRGVQLMFGTECESIAGDVVTMRSIGTNETRKLSTQSVYVAIGRRPRQVPGYLSRAVRLGDAAKAGSALDAIRQGTFHAAFTYEQS